MMDSAPRLQEAARVLVVEDEPDIAALVAYQLTREGFRVETAATGTEALSAVHREMPDLLVLDRMLPGISGDEVLKTLKGEPSTSGVPNIAKAVRRMAEAPALPTMPEVPEMAGIARGMLGDALAAFVARDPSSARLVCMRDDKVDNMRRSLFRILLTHMMEEPRRITAALELLLISQNLERIADLSTNIAEDVVFMVEGQTIKHHAERQTPD